MQYLTNLDHCFHTVLEPMKCVLGGTYHFYSEGEHLYRETQKKNVETVKALISHGFSPSFNNPTGIPERFTPVLEAASNVDLPMLDVLLRISQNKTYSYRLQTKSDLKLSPLHILIAAGSLEGVQLFLEHQPKNININYLAHMPSFVSESSPEKTPPYVEVTPLSCAAAADSLSIISYLKSIGADVDLPNEDNTTPLMISARKAKDMSCLTLLLSSDAKAKAKVSLDNQNRNPLHHLMKNKVIDKKTRSFAISVLVAHGVNIEQRDKYGEYPLQMAAIEEPLDTATINELLFSGAETQKLSNKSYARLINDSHIKQAMAGIESVKLSILEEFLPNVLCTLVMEYDSSVPTTDDSLVDLESIEKQKKDTLEFNSLKKELKNCFTHCIKEVEELEFTPGINSAYIKFNSSLLSAQKKFNEDYDNFANSPEFAESVARHLFYYIVGCLIQLSYAVVNEIEKQFREIELESKLAHEFALKEKRMRKPKRKKMHASSKGLQGSGYDKKMTSYLFSSEKTIKKLYGEGAKVISKSIEADNAKDAKSALKLILEAYDMILEFMVEADAFAEEYKIIRSSLEKTREELTEKFNPQTKKSP